MLPERDSLMAAESRERAAGFVQLVPTSRLSTIPAAPIQLGIIGTHPPKPLVDFGLAVKRILIQQLSDPGPRM